jgi:hypothetical protein
MGMARRFLLSLLLVFAADSLCAQSRSLPLCIVQTKPDQTMHWDPSAGPWAIEVYNQLSGQKLRNGSSLKITVLPASVQKDVLPEVRRLQCALVVQLWFSHIADSSPMQAGVSSGENFSPLNPLLAGPGPARSEDSLFFSLWNAATGKILSRGSAPLRSPVVPGPPGLRDGTPCTAFAHETLKRLNQVR